MDSQYFPAAMLGAALVIFAVGLLLAVFVGGALLRLAVRWVDKFTPGYLRCCGAMALAVVIGVAAQFALGAVLALLPGAAALFATDPGMGAIAALFAASVALSTLAVALAAWLVVPRPDGGRLPFVRAVIAGALTTALGFVVYGVCVALLLLLVGGVPGVAR